MTLYGTDGSLIDSITVGYLLPGHSIMRSDDSGAWCLTDSPTTGEINGSNCISGYTDTPNISPVAGFYQNDQTITCLLYTSDAADALP